MGAWVWVVGINIFGINKSRDLCGLYDCECGICDGRDCVLFSINRVFCKGVPPRLSISSEPCVLLHCERTPCVGV